jgi:hypothetical protein
MRMPQDTDTDSDNSAPDLVEDDANRLSDDEEFPISDEDELMGEDEEIEDESEGEDASDEIEEEDDGAVKGWAGSMAKVLKSDKTGVLSKAKKVEDVAKKKEKKPYAFEIDGEEENEDEEKPDQTALERALAKRKYRERKEVSLNSDKFEKNC